eukprot:CAMPEP_0183752806 /NCGR_PEP_ID=MMETSP0739-20130205/2558_1 /TAXON_ID=385413 /ORGANISM="Thalassiosira miniscula, Strain CCMP1093" /LENGTH=175 /DNA_ID=CAMNT_0025989207 /DNA_START=43 /DNA_END=570 /DNA_ORIENTATION=+
MAAALSKATAFLSFTLCDGSSRKLIAGWWYFILFVCIIQVFIALFTMSSRGGTEAFVSLWSSIVLLVLCVGGTVIMRKFQSSVAVGFFMGSVVAASQMFLLLFLILFGYIEDRLENDLPVDGERLNGFVCLVQSILLGSFAAILAAHRSEILDQKISVEEEEDPAYEAPARTTVV